MFSRKKVSAIILAGSLALSLGACSSSSSDTSGEKKESTGYPKKAI
ncbi:transporter, partial [Bacillus sp. mrc49]